MKEGDLERELRFHLEQHEADLIARGVAPEEARRRARMELGGLEQVREECREQRPGWWRDRLVADVKYAWRGFRQSPAAGLAFVATLAVCIAVNTAVFAVVDSLLLRPLPFERADRLVIVTNQYPKAGIGDNEQSAAGDLKDRRQGVPAIAEHALYSQASHAAGRDGQTVQLRGLAVTASFFPLLRVRMAEGRAFHESEMEPGRHRVVILTQGLRREIFGAWPVLGQNVRLDGQEFRVSGVLPAGFRFVRPDVRYFVPLALSAEDWQGHHNNNYGYLGRLRDGATVQQAQAQVDLLNQQMLEQLAAFRDLLVRAGFHSRVDSFQPWLMRRFARGLQLLWAGALLVLLMGAVNLAGLALARAAARGRERATRVALGATQGDLARQSFLEAALPAAVGAVLGVGGGVVLLQVFDHSLLPGAAEIAPGPLVLGYAAAGALFVAMVVALASMWPARNWDLARALHDGSRGGTARQGGLRRWLVVAQVALALVLLNGAGVLLASMRELLAVDPGFRVAGLRTATTALPRVGHDREADRLRAMERLVQALRDTPGIPQFGIGTSMPFDTDFQDNVIVPEGFRSVPGQSAVSPRRIAVMPGYLETLGVARTEGRFFDGRDQDGAPRTIILDERLARRFWPGQSALGRRVSYPKPDGQPDPDAWMTVVGVTKPMRLRDLADSDAPVGTYYLPWPQMPGRSFSIVWQGPASSGEAVRAALAKAAPGAALFDVRAMEDRQSLTLEPLRLARLLGLVFAGVALLLAVMGIYGLLAHLLAQRRREIGIRLALGCLPRSVAVFFLLDGGRLVLLGVAGGLAGAWLARPWLGSHLYGVGAMDPRVLALVIAAIALASVGAMLAPAWRASRVDPVRVLNEN